MRATTSSNQLVKRWCGCGVIRLQRCSKMLLLFMRLLLTSAVV
jgi:hypothetical protein